MDESRRVLGVCHGCIVLSDKVTTLRATLAEKDAAIRAVNSWWAARFYLRGNCGGCVTYNRANRQHHPDCRYAKWLGLPAVASALAAPDVV